MKTKRKRKTLKPLTVPILVYSTSGKPVSKPVEEIKLTPWSA